jgi:hypothetical protein
VGTGWPNNIPVKIRPTKKVWAPTVALAKYTVVSVPQGSLLRAGSLFFVHGLVSIQHLEMLILAINEQVA